jgi:phosphate-selective porin OprO/OprP
LNDIGSITFKLDDTRWGTRIDLSGATGYSGQSDIWGFTLMPYVNVTAPLQLVARYTVVRSEDDNGVQLATYESRVVRGRGDKYQEAYLGANYYLYGHRLKLQTGLQFATMRDRAHDGGRYSGTSWISGLRIGW